MQYGRAASGYYLVGIGLMTYVEYELVVGSVIYIIKADHQLDGSEARSQVAGIYRAAFYHVMAYLGTEFPQFFCREALDVRR